ncbi:MAG: DJ-1/PfpI family protein [Lachnospiraceae bacterium]|uniref:DJ-1/PfpI family protein n=1 Tax=Candidatus Enterocloster excrementigallinarum TaxID=2838558 RepID=A0A9D2PV81_9FIRM|nr:DJ-1/PfpI family protein [Lachnospiraceae bacterium]HJC66863.1 DJ-1/PfpI family protein [Candidatus Enterocloster excrementigallinarum]
MCKVLAFLADGLEEVECLAVVDVLRRADIDVTLVSMSGNKQVTGSHGITIVADALYGETNPQEADLLFLPGGMPGTANLKAHKQLGEALEEANRQGRRIAAICAAPSVLGSLGLLKGKTATCYPGYEEQLDGASCSQAGVITDGNITTARGLGYALDLGIELVRLFSGSEHAAKVKRAIQYER